MKITIETNIYTPEGIYDDLYKKFLDDKSVDININGIRMKGVVQSVKSVFRRNGWREIEKMVIETMEEVEKNEDR